MSADAVDEDSDTATEESEPSTFLDGIEFLTGEDPSAGSFLLVVGMVTCVFIAGFQLTFPAPISWILTALVLVVAVISFIIGAILDILDYFDTPSDDARPADTGVEVVESQSSPDVAESQSGDGRTDETRAAETQPMDAEQVDLDPVDTRQGDAPSDEN
jgi:hypothetical protein